MASVSTTAKDAAGRIVKIGDVVGGTTSGRYQETIIGPIRSFGKGTAVVEVTNTGQHNGLRPSNGDKVRISTNRRFYVREGET